MLSSASYLVSFPQQTTDGTYTISVATNIVDLYGQPMSPAFTGGFAILPVTNIAPYLTAAANATNFILGWQGIAGVNYQVYSSTNLTNWLPYGSAFIGSNGPVQILVPTGSNSAQFFSVQAGD
jgi:hypothetical protein